MILEVHPENPQPRAIQRAAEALESGGLVVYPTDTAYGLGCDIRNRRAIDAIYQLKQRERKKPLSIICADLTNLAQYAVVTNQDYRILRRCLPGPFTFVLPAARAVPRKLMPRRRTVGLRVPDHPVPLALVAALGHALVSTTVCLEGEEPMVDPAEIEDRFGHAVSCVLDAGPAAPNRLSTIVDLCGAEAEIIREGVGPTALLF